MHMHIQHTYTPHTHTNTHITCTHTYNTHTHIVEYFLIDKNFIVHKIFHWKIILSFALLGKYCENDFKSYMQRRFEAKDPRATLEEGKRVTQCALEFFRKMKETCNTQFTNHWKCLDYHNQMYGNCRHTQKPYDTCVLQNFGLVTDQPVHIEGEI